MSNWQKEAKDPLAPKTLFTIKHSEIPQGKTQCVNHVWKKLNDNELECLNCPTCVIVNSDIIDSII